MTFKRKTKAGGVAMPWDWQVAFRQQAIEEGMSVSEWIGKASIKRLPRSIARKLSSRPKQQNLGRWKPDRIPLRYRSLGVSQPKDWWIAFRQQAAKEGVSLSKWMSEAGKSQLPKSIAKKLSARKRQPRSGDWPIKW